MFFNFGPFSFGQRSQQRQRPRPNQTSFRDFLARSFMNPSASNPQENQNQDSRQQAQQSRPSYYRNTRSSVKEEESKNIKQNKDGVNYSQNTGIFWKQKGNHEFQTGNYQTALKCYSKAIELNNTESIFFSNRARVYKIMGKLQQALRDAQQAIQLDVGNIKGHLLCGQILAQIGKQNKNIDKVYIALARLKKALTLCSGQKKTQFQKQLSTYIYRAKKLLWYLKFQELRTTRINAINQYKNYLEKDTTISPQQYQQKIDAFLSATNETVIFQIPDYLCCRITLDIMEDPVTTDSGQSYERSVIEEHIKKNGKIDPLTRQPITGKLYSSIGLKKAIQDFLDKNPWAYQYKEGQNYNDILF